MKSLVIVFAALLVVVSFPFLFRAVENARVDQVTQTFSGLTTGAGGYTSNATLSIGLYSANITQVRSISSNVSADSPSAASYSSASRLLTINGLVPSTTRTVSIVYNISSSIVADYIGISAFLTFYVWLIVFICLGLLVGAVYAFFQN